MDEDHWVECGDHGRMRAAYVCRHLVESLHTGSPVGFVQADEDLQAWCDACEAVRVQENGWNDQSESFAHVTLICSGCFTRAKTINTHEN